MTTQQIEKGQRLTLSLVSWGRLGEAMKYNIRSIPALIFFKDGQAVETIIGAVPKGQLKRRIDAVLES